MDDKKTAAVRAEADSVRASMRGMTRDELYQLFESLWNAPMEPEKLCPRCMASMTRSGIRAELVADVWDQYKRSRRSIRVPRIGG